MAGEKMKKKTDSSLRKKTHKGVDNMMDKADSISKSCKETVAHAKGKAIMIRESVNGHIRKHPENSVLIAAGTGAFAGAIIAAALMRKKR